MPPKKTSIRAARKPPLTSKSIKAGKDYTKNINGAGENPEDDSQSKKKTATSKVEGEESIIQLALLVNTSSLNPKTHPNTMTSTTNLAVMVESQAPLSFPKFAELPMELRVKIWRERFPGPRMIHVYELGPWQEAYQRPSKRSHKALFRLRTTCKELNQEILREYRLVPFAEMGMSLSTTPIDSASKYPFILLHDKQDTIYFSMDILWAHYDGRYQLSPSAYSSLRSIAISTIALPHLYTDKRTNNNILGSWLEGFSGLQKFALIERDTRASGGDWSPESQGYFYRKMPSESGEENYTKDFRKALLQARETRPDMMHMANVAVEILGIEWACERVNSLHFAITDLGNPSKAMSKPRPLVKKGRRQV